MSDVSIDKTMIDKAMILAAGRGLRMGSLTASLPKPLLRVAGHYLIEYAIANIKRAGITDILINVSYRSEQIKTALGDGSRYGVSIVYSEEKEPLETGGGIVQALPWLGKKPFLVYSSDIISDFPLARLPTAPMGLAHLIMVDNPVYNQRGDFALVQGRLLMQAPSLLTFGSMGVYRPELFAHCATGPFPLARVLVPYISAGLITGEHYQGSWYNIGTAKDLEDINQRAREDLNLRPLASETNTLSN